MMLKAPVKNIVEFKGISDRVAFLTWKTYKVKNIQVCAPNSLYTDEENNMLDEDVIKVR